MNFSKYKKGYTLLFAIIVSSIVLSVAAFILSSSRRQFILSSIARDSTMAIYAADSGAQCAHDALMKNLLASTSDANIPCAATDHTEGFEVFEPTSDLKMKTGAYKLIDPITIYLPGKTCARVMVMWGYDNTTGNLKIIIDSRGYNFDSYFPCVSEPTNQRMIERTIRLQFDR